MTIRHNHPHRVVGGTVKRSFALAAAVAAWACSPDSGKRATGDSSEAVAAATPSGGADLTGAGATFPYPIYRKWIDQYAAKTGIQINYQAIGSGGGIRQFI